MKSLSIVLIEDDEADVFLVRESLDSRHIAYQLAVAQDGEAGLRMIDEFGVRGPCPDIILLDLNLPRAVGGELLEHIRLNPNCSGVPVLVVTSSNSPRDIKTIKDFAARHFRKPSELDEYMTLADVVIEMLRGSQDAVGAPAGGV